MMLTVCYNGNRFTIPEQYAHRVEELGIRSGVEITPQQFKWGVALLNQIRFELGLMPNQQKIVRL